MQNLGKVVVLLGGHSSEREVSLMSGEGVLKALREKGVDAHAFDPAREPVEALLQGGYDRAFIALHGGAGENGTIQGLLNFLRLPYTGPGVAASAASFDKEVTKTLWRAAGLPVPEGRVMTGDEDDAALEAVIRTGCRARGKFHRRLDARPSHDGVASRSPEACEVALRRNPRRRVHPRPRIHGGGPRRPCAPRH